MFNCIGTNELELHIKQMIKSLGSVIKSNKSPPKSEKNNRQVNSLKTLRAKKSRN